MTPRRITQNLAAILLFALIAAACGGSSTPQATTTDRDVVASEGATEDADPEQTDDDVISKTAGESQEAPLFDPTAVDLPYDVSASAEPNDEDVQILTGNPRDLLHPTAASISGLWTTDWSRTTIDIGELRAGLRGEDPRDGIPPIDRPLFESVTAASEWLQPTEPGALVSLDGDVRFYPLSIMTRHEIVNDRFGNVPVAITFCPLCNTALAFDARVDGQRLRFGVSGLLRKSDLVMWDRQSETLWQQISGTGVIGEYAGTELTLVPTSIVSFGDFSATHPDGLSLSRETGFGTNYGTNPYTGYSSGAGPIPAFFPEELDDRLPPMARVVSVIDGDAVTAYPFSAVSETGLIADQVGDLSIAIFWGGATTDALDEQSIANSEQIGSAIAYLAEFEDQSLTFTANGDDTFTDAETGATWNLLGAGIAGENEGETLTIAPHRNEFWFAFAGFFPEGKLWES